LRFKLNELGFPNQELPTRENVQGGRYIVGSSRDINEAMQNFVGRRHGETFVARRTGATQVRGHPNREARIGLLNCPDKSKEFDHGTGNLWVEDDCDDDINMVAPLQALI
jgi:hypothetical protein